ncbi:Protein yls7 [Asimina triloba]
MAYPSPESFLECTIPKSPCWITHKKAFDDKRQRFHQSGNLQISGRNCESGSWNFSQHSPSAPAPAPAAFGGFFWRFVVCGVGSDRFTTAWFVFFPSLEFFRGFDGLPSARAWVLPPSSFLDSRSVREGVESQLPSVMMLGSPKGMPGVAAFPRSNSSIVALVAGLALFLVFASWILISNPVSIDPSRKLELTFVGDTQTTNLIHQTESLQSGESGDGQHDENGRTGSPGSFLASDGMREVGHAGGSVPVKGRKEAVVTLYTPDTQKTDINSTAIAPASDKALGIGLGASTDGSTASDNLIIHESPVSEATSGDGGASNDGLVSSSSTMEAESKNEEKVNSEAIDDGSSSSNSTDVLLSVSSPAPDSSDEVDSGAHNDVSEESSPNSTTAVEPRFPILSSEKPGSRSCDLYKGKWFHDPAGPLYTNNSCPIITQMQNCQGNGRPDKDYENWRWKPDQCDLPRFDPKKFLELLRGKKLAFIGDSVEAPINRGNRKMQRWFFRSTSTFIVRIWSSWLVHRTSESFQNAPEGIDKLHLDVPDETFMEFLPQFDVVVISSGHWFAKQSVYIVNNDIGGWQLWKPDKHREMTINNVEAYRISVETILTAMASHPNYTGLTIVRSFSPDHYEGGAWNTGGSCTGKVRPAQEGELAMNGFTDKMHEMQVMGFEKAIEKAKNKSKLRLMDITHVFDYRVDGHPGPYRSPDPNKKTKRGPHGEPPPQDCLHWCMPGPVDTWNELVLEIIRREFEANKGPASTALKQQRCACQMPKDPDLTTRSALLFKQANLQLSFANMMKELIISVVIECSDICSALPLEVPWATWQNGDDQSWLLLHFVSVGQKCKWSEIVATALH